MEGVEVECDLKAGTFKVRGEQASVLLMLERLNAILEKFFNPAASSPRQETPNRPSPEPEHSQKSKSEQVSAESVVAKSSEKTRRTISSKAPNYQIVTVIDDEIGQRTLKSYFDQISPQSQNDIVATIAYKAKEITSKDTFSTNDIFSLCRIAGAKVPKNLSAVFGNMRGGSLGGGSSGEFSVTWQTEDHVKKLEAKAVEK